MKPASRARPHRHDPDPEDPGDHRGRRTCRTCRLVGVQGDAHHPDTAPAPAPRLLTPDQADAARQRDAAILGERDD